MRLSKPGKDRLIAGLIAAGCPTLIQIGFLVFAQEPMSFLTWLGLTIGMFVLVEAFGALVYMKTKGRLQVLGVFTVLCAVFLVLAPGETSAYLLFGGAASACPSPCFVDGTSSSSHCRSGGKPVRLTKQEPEI